MKKYISTVFIIKMHIFFVILDYLLFCNLTYLWSVVEHLIVLTCLVKSKFSSHGNVGQLLLNTEDVPAHLLNSILIYATYMNHRGHQDICYQWTQSLKDVL